MTLELSWRRPRREKAKGWQRGVVRTGSQPAAVVVGDGSQASWGAQVSMPRPGASVSLPLCLSWSLGCQASAGHGEGPLGLGSLSDVTSTLAGTGGSLGSGFVGVPDPPSLPGKWQQAVLELGLP